MIPISDIYLLEEIEYEGEILGVWDAEIIDSYVVFTTRRGKLYVPLIGYSSWYGDFAEYEWSEAQFE